MEHEERGGPKTEREFEIGRDESWFANIKRTYEEYQDLSLESCKRNRTIVDKLLSDAQQHDNVRQTIANQALQNAVETANIVSKQAIRHTDLAIDRQWNLDEVSHLAVGGTTAVNAIAAAVAAAVLEALKPK